MRRAAPRLRVAAARKDRRGAIAARGERGGLLPFQSRRRRGRGAAVLAGRGLAAAGRRAARPRRAAARRRRLPALPPRDGLRKNMDVLRRPPRGRGGHRGRGGLRAGYQRRRPSYKMHEKMVGQVARVRRVAIRRAGPARGRGGRGRGSRGRGRDVLPEVAHGAPHVRGARHRRRPGAPGRSGRPRVMRGAARGLRLLFSYRRGRAVLLPARGGPARRAAALRAAGARGRGPGALFKSRGRAAVSSQRLVLRGRRLQGESTARPRPEGRPRRKIPSEASSGPARAARAAWRGGRLRATEGELARPGAVPGRAGARAVSRNHGPRGRG
mmetsp:Transcript_33031/g.99576  ORF Transcript_33031/g.99576 Transcript_33031/m.99576 type:complete len:327 (+) Transcript_33031:906-1886(+)